MFRNCEYSTFGRIKTYFAEVLAVARFIPGAELEALTKLSEVPSVDGVELRG